MTDDPPELKGCPICNKQPKIHHSKIFDKRWIIACRDPEEEGTWENHHVITTGNTIEEAAEKWNTRQEPDELPREVMNAFHRLVDKILNDV